MRYLERYYARQALRGSQGNAQSIAGVLVFLAVFAFLLYLAF